jgi:hypothetical protein
MRQNAPVDDYIGWFEEEVKAVSRAVWQLNDNFVVLAIEGVLNMLHSSDCQELSVLHDLGALSDTSVIEDIPGEVHKIARHLVWRWWKNHGLSEALCRLEGASVEMVSCAKS